MNPDEQKARALALILDAWELALGEGVEPELLASAALFAAFTDMIDLHGTEAVAVMAEGLAARVRAGEFTLSDEPLE
jgi:hypothetical protein